MGRPTIWEMGGRIAAGARERIGGKMESLSSFYSFISDFPGRIVGALWLMHLGSQIGTIDKSAESDLLCIRHSLLRIPFILLILCLCFLISIHPNLILMATLATLASCHSPPSPLLSLPTLASSQSPNLQPLGPRASSSSHPSDLPAHQ